MKTVVDVPRYG